MSLDPKVAPKGPTASLTLRIPVSIIEDMRNASMFNKFTPFPNVSQFAVDAFIRNLELWVGDRISPELKAALKLAEMEHKESIKNAVAELAGKCQAAITMGDYKEAREIVTYLPSEHRTPFIRQLQDLGQMMTVVE